jgi:hypothetical protein
MRSLLFAMALSTLLGAQTLTTPEEIRKALAQVPADETDPWLDCAVAPIKPVLSFGLRLQAGYTFRFRLGQFPGPGHKLTVLTTVTPEGSKQPIHLIDRLGLPAIPRSDMDGESGGGFFVGEGRYQVNWLLFDEQGRKCMNSWGIDARLGRADRAVKLVIPPGSVTELSLGRGPARRADPVPPRRLTILLDAAPFTFGRSATAMIDSSDQVMLLGALSALVERVPASSVRLVVFNLEQQKELLRRDGFTLESIDEVARTLNELKLGKVDVQVLQSRTGHLDLLAGLINRELRADPPADVVIFLGPRERYHDKLPAKALEPHSGAAPRFLYLACRAPRQVQGGLAGDQGSDVASGMLLDMTPAWDGVKDNPTSRKPVRGVIPDSPERLPDTVSLVVGALKGKTLDIDSPSQFAKAIQAIERPGGR